MGDINQIELQTIDSIPYAGDTPAQIKAKLGTATAINEVINRSVLFDEWESKNEVSLFYDKKGIWHPRDDFRFMDNWK